MVQAQAATTENRLQDSCPEHYLQTKRVIRSSFDQHTLHEKHITPSQHGFVRAVYHAYSHHHHPTLRPEDVWLSILSQLNFFVKAHADEVRAFFVTHQGQKHLQVFDSGIIATVDFGAPSVRMTELIEKNVVDPELRTWIMPTFSTTTASDRVIAAVLMIGALQKYFSYEMVLMCGIPSVTLLGERDDWARQDPSAGRRASAIRPTPPAGTREFMTFGLNVPMRRVGSGPHYLSGWITAFCFWDNEGHSLYRGGSAGYKLDGVQFHRIDMGDIPGGFASVPVKVNDNGTIYETKMVSGMVGIQASSSDEVDGQDETREPLLDSIQPVSGWWMYELMGQKGENPKRRLVECQDDAKFYQMTKLPWRGANVKA